MTRYGTAMRRPVLPHGLHWASLRKRPVKANWPSITLDTCEFATLEPLLWSNSPRQQKWTERSLRRCMLNKQSEHSAIKRDRRG
jgi:hypothetical protein